MENIELFGFNPAIEQRIPLFTMTVSAGLPIPAESDVEGEVDLNEFLVENPNSTFFARITGDFGKDSRIQDGDILIVDSQIEPEDGKFVIIQINNQLTVRIYRIIDAEPYIQSLNEQFVPLNIENYISFDLIGVVTKIIHSF